jgi:hypothetical protein
MYAFYADESGFSKQSHKFEVEQPVLVVLGILIDISKLRKAIDVFDNILTRVNALVSYPVTELKFTDIRNKKPFKDDLPTIDERANLLSSIIEDFQSEISFKIFYCAIDNELFFKAKKTESILKDSLKHPYIAASYKILSQLDRNQAPKKSNKGKTFVIFDEQNQYQENIETLVASPLHISKFSEIFDTSYFGKSHYSKLIQIADLLAGTFRYYLTQIKANKTIDTDHWTKRISEIIEKMKPHIIHKECFNGSTLKELYPIFEMQIP